MRLTYDTIFEITGMRRKSKQAVWFLENLGVEVPKDRLGVIMTDAAYQKLLEKRLGLTNFVDNSETKPRINRRK